MWEDCFRTSMVLHAVQSDAKTLISPSEKLTCIREKRVSPSKHGFHLKKNDLFEIKEENGKFLKISQKIDIEGTIPDVDTIPRVAHAKPRVAGVHAEQRVYPLLKYNSEKLLGEKVGCEVIFHTRVIFLGDEVPTYQNREGVVSAALHGALWECDSTRRAWRANLHTKATAILDKSTNESPWRRGLSALADMYLATPTIFLEVLFEIPSETGFENNFCAIVPVTKRPNGDLAQVQMPFNGCMWEKMKEGSPLRPGVAMCAGAEDVTRECAAVQALFAQRSIMYYGMKSLSPFNKTPRGGKVVKDMYSTQNMYTYHFMYGMHSDIGQTHLWMKEHEVPLEFVRNVLQRAFSRIGSDTCFCTQKKQDRFVKDLILQSIAYCIHETDLGMKSYRTDLCGEDVRTRTMQRVLTANSPLIPGGDCEDQAQTFAQLVYTAKGNLEWLVQQMPMYADILHYIFNKRCVCVC